MPSTWKIVKLTRAIPIVMLTSLDGARSRSILPTGGTRPIQLSNRIRMNAAAKIGMYGRAAGPAIPTPKSLRNSYTVSMTFWPRPGTGFALRTIRIEPARTIAITIHIVRIVLLMLGWKVTRSVADAGVDGARSITAWGAGNSRLFSMKQAGNAQSATPLLATCGNATKATMSRTMTKPTRASQRGASRRSGFRSGVGAVSESRATMSVATSSLDTLPPHTGARLAAALDPVHPGPIGPLFDRIEEPADQAVNHHRSGPGTDEEADDHEERQGPELLIDPTADQHADEGRDQERNADLGKESGVRPAPAGLDHGRPDKAAAV